MIKISQIGANFPKTVLLFLGGLTLLGAYCLTGARMDNSIEVWFASEDPNLHFYDEFRERFGTEEFLMIALCEDDAFSEETMAIMGDLVAGLLEFEELDKVESLAKIYSRWAESREKGEVEFDLESFRKDMLSSPLYVGLLVSPSGRDSVIMAQLSNKGISDRAALTDKTLALVEKVVPPERTVFYAGSAIFNTEMNTISRRSAMIFYPIVVLSGAILLLFALGSGRMTVAACFAVIAAIVWGIGALAGSGIALNVVTSALPPILLVSTVSYALHFLMEYRRQVKGRHDRRRAVIASLDLVGIPCALSAVTTSVGFASLMVSQVEPVIELGGFAAVGVLGAVLAVLFGLGSLTVLMGIPKKWQRPDDHRAEAEGSSVPPPAKRRHFGFQEGWYPARWGIVAVGVAYTAVAGYYAGQVFFEANPFEFFPEDNIVSTSHHYLEEELSGLSRLEIQVETKTDADLMKLPALRDFEKAAEALVAIPHVRKAITPADYVKEARRAHSLGEESAFKLPRRPTQLRQTLREFVDHDLKKRLEDRFTEDHRYAKMTLQIDTLGSRAYGATLEKIQAALDESLGEDYETRLTGLVPLVSSSQKYMVDSQIRSLSLAVGSIALIFVFLFRSIRLTLLGLIPNLIPILGAFGYMGWREIPLDVATIMVASVSLGIVVDNTIHFLFRYRRELRGNDPLHALLETLRTTGQAIALAGAINCVGFAVLIFSGFQPMENFGLLVSITMFGALLGATILLPALLLTFGPKGGGKRP